MAWRFKASKYKNSAPIVPKPEMCIRDIVVGSYQTFGNNIAASAKFMAFNWEHVGSSLAVLTLDDSGRKSKTMPLLHAHSDTVTDLEFSPFHDGLLASASQDCSVKIWHIPEKGLEQSLSDAECTFNCKQRRVETVGFHPTCDCFLYSTAAGCVTLWDLVKQKEFFADNQHPDIIQSLSWKQDGTIFATSCKDKMLRIVDPRSSSNPITASVDSHQNIKDSRVVWLGDQDRILTTGFDAGRLRQVIVRDVRNLSVPQKVLELDCSTGILVPLFDPDTNMLFLAGKGDTTISFQEVTDREPFLIEGLRHSGEQTKGACLVPKRALRVMEGEVNRVLQLTSNSVIPIMYQVPRKTYRDFHGDIFPDTNGSTSELLPTEWLSGKNISLKKISLDPVQREHGEKPIIILRGTLNDIVNNLSNNIKKQTKEISVKPVNIPIKTKIQMMEQQAKIKAEFDEFEQKFKTITTANKMEETQNILNRNYNIIHSNQDDESDIVEKNGNFIGNKQNEHDDHIANATKDTRVINNVTPPKPMPRTSISEQGSFEENTGNAIPKPRPRTTASSTGYKPRLGPKPFSSEAKETSFDKVFAVPSVPTNVTIEKTNKIPDKPEELISECDQAEEPEKIYSDRLDETETCFRTPISVRKKSASDEEEMFENSSANADSKNPDDNSDDRIEEFDRNSQRSSIADRRRLYENRSQSVLEEKSSSPTLKRRNSLKNREEKAADTADGKKTVSNGTNNSNTNQIASNGISKRTSTVFGKVSKFRHLKGTTGHKSTHIENIKNISRQISGECDGFCGNFERVAVPLSGAGGKIAIFELNKTGRLPDGVIPSLVNGSNIMDFQWNPFNNSELAVACDDGSVKLWSMPQGGLTEPTNTPEREFVAHNDKIYFIKFHPLAKNVLLTASYDMTMKLWDLETLEEKRCLKGHTDQIFSFAWSPCGSFGATVCKDGKLRMYNLRKADQPIKEGIGGPVGSRGARIMYALEGEVLVVTGFDKVSERQIYAFKLNNLDQPIGMVGLDVSPAILIPFYDEDSSTVFLTGKGDSTIYAYEVTEEAPFLCPLSHHRCSSLHQGLSFLPKNQCDVASVEFAKCLRLTNNSVEPLSFAVPRIKTEFFQDDLFPPTRKLWEPTMSSKDWFTMNDNKPIKVNLQPDGMELLSSLQSSVTPIPHKKIETVNEGPNNNNGTQLRQWSIETTKAKQEEIKNSVSARMELNLNLEQDDMEGVDAEEWEE